MKLVLQRAKYSRLARILRVNGGLYERLMERGGLLRVIILAWRVEASVCDKLVIWGLLGN